MTATPGLVSVGHAAITLGVTSKTIRNYLDRGILEGCVLPTGHRRVTLESLDRVKSVMAQS